MRGLQLGVAEELCGFGYCCLQPPGLRVAGASTVAELVLGLAMDVDIIPP